MTEWSRLSFTSEVKFFFEELSWKIKPWLNLVKIFRCLFVFQGSEFLGSFAIFWNAKKIEASKKGSAKLSQIAGNFMGRGIIWLNQGSETALSYLGRAVKKKCLYPNSGPPIIWILSVCKRKTFCFSETNLLICTKYI